MRTSHCFFLLCCLLLSLASNAYSTQKKIIHFGFVSPSSPDLFTEEALRKLDGNCPFDGIGINPVIRLQREGKSIVYQPLHHVGSPYLLTQEDFRALIPAYRRLQSTRLKHNYFILNSSPFNEDWFDDEGWKRTLNNFSLLAWAAKESGFDGICLDLEPYPLTKLPFMFRPHLGHTFQETSAQVRLRAKEWIEELNRQFPNLTLFTFYWTAQCNSSFLEQHPESLENTKSGLALAFFNGVYDGAPETMTIVDGNEAPGYHAASEKDYAQIIGRFHRYASSWIDAGNQEKFWRITTMGISFFLDSYAKRNNPGKYNHFSLSDNPTQLLATNVSHALDYADEYVWFWCEKGNFWPEVFPSKYQSWEKLIPHCAESIETGRNLHASMEKYASPTNLLRNGALDSGDSGKPNYPDLYDSGIKFWPAWQGVNTPQGTITSENGMVRFLNVTEGAISQAICGVKPRQQFIIRARCKNESRFAMPVLDCFYRDTPDIGPWGHTSTTFTEEDADGWKRATLHITVPDGHNIASLHVYVGVNGFQDPSGKDKGCLFDDIEVHEVRFPWQKK